MHYQRKYIYQSKNSTGEHAAALYYQVGSCISERNWKNIYFDRIQEIGRWQSLVLNIYSGESLTDECYILQTMQTSVMHILPLMYLYS